jgi:hypothetical protein
MRGRQTLRVRREAEERGSQVDLRGRGLWAVRRAERARPRWCRRTGSFQYRGRETA